LKPGKQREKKCIFMSDQTNGDRIKTRMSKETKRGGEKLTRIMDNQKVKQSRYSDHLTYPTFRIHFHFFIIHSKTCYIKRYDKFRRRRMVDLNCVAVEPGMDLRQSFELRVEQRLLHIFKRRSHQITQLELNFQ
jgi:hypothetical protein